MTANRCDRTRIAYRFLLLLLQVILTSAFRDSYTSTSTKNHVDDQIGTFERHMLSETELTKCKSSLWLISNDNSKLDTKVYPELIEMMSDGLIKASGFEELPIFLILVFWEAICTVSLTSCSSGGVGVWRLVNSEDGDILEHFCSTICEYLENYVFNSEPTISTTTSPILTPSFSPSIFPTSKPTVMTSTLTSLAPTESPQLIIIPTLIPSEQRKDSYFVPSNSPSSTHVPSSFPSVNPSNPEISSPTMTPSISISSPPTTSLTISPSNSSSNVTALTPSCIPTISPNQIDHSDLPTKSPLSQSTSSPTIKNTTEGNMPTLSPNITSQIPSIMVTTSSIAPSRHPVTQKPSNFNSHRPTIKPAHTMFISKATFQQPFRLTSLFNSTEQDSFCEIMRQITGNIAVKSRLGRIYIEKDISTTCIINNVDIMNPVKNQSSSHLKRSSPELTSFILVEYIMEYTSNVVDVSKYGSSFKMYINANLKKLSKEMHKGGVSVQKSYPIVSENYSDTNNAPSSSTLVPTTGSPSQYEDSTKTNGSKLSDNGKTKKTSFPYAQLLVILVIVYLLIAAKVAKRRRLSPWAHLFFTRSIVQKD